MKRVPNSVRIVGGTHRGRRIRFPEVTGLRPTPDRVRETLFNWLGQDLAGLRCLDLFAGSGALGIEALSRQASSVTLVDRSPKVVASIREALTLLHADRDRAEVDCCDALEFIARMRRAGRRFDLIFLDPPFGEGWIDRLDPLLPELLQPGGRVYVESAEPWHPGAGLRGLRQGRAGSVHYALAEAAPADVPEGGEAGGAG